MKLNVRCPACSKLYEVQSDEIHSEIPVFKCVSCSSKFAFEFSESENSAVETFLIPAETSTEIPNALRQEMPSIVEPTVQQEMKNCPKCGAMNGRKSKECYSCNVLFDRLEGLPTDPNLRAHPSLVRKWKNLLENFENESLHEEFIKSCHAVEALRFATSKYEEIRQAQGGDGFCDQMIARIQGLALVHMTQKPVAKPAKVARPKWHKYLFWSPYALSGMLILFGMLNMGHRNLIGLGVAISCMASGLIVMIRGKISVADFVD